MNTVKKSKCKKSQVYNKSTGRCRRRCSKKQKRSKVTGLCINKKSAPKVKKSLRKNSSRSTRKASKSSVKYLKITKSGNITKIVKSTRKKYPKSQIYVISKKIKYPTVDVVFPTKRKRSRNSRSRNSRSRNSRSRK